MSAMMGQGRPELMEWKHTPANGAKSRKHQEYVSHCCVARGMKMEIHTR